MILQPQKYDFDMIVIGAGFGGIGTALTLAQDGKKILLLEKLNYPGGCAGSFVKKGHSFEAGATLSSGFNDGQIFKKWCDQYQLDVKTTCLNPSLSLISKDFKFDVPSDFPSYLSYWETLASTTSEIKAAQIKKFFEHQQVIANTLWEILDHPESLPDITPWKLIKYWQKIPKLLHLLPNIHLSLFDVLKRYQLHTFQPLCLFLNALCQITLQCNLQQANANFALATMDYYFRGVRHIEGGIGQLSKALCQAIEQEGGLVKLAHGVQKIEKNHQTKLWQVSARGETYTTPIVIANLQPKALSKLISSASENKTISPKKQNQIENAWSAALWYLVLPCSQDDKARHLQMIADPNAPLQEGNHLFCSFSQVYLDGNQYFQSVTISTHIPLTSYLTHLQNQTVASYIEQVQAKMLNLFNQFTDSAKSSEAKHAFPASPRTIERFTGRPFGAVGGIPKTKGLSTYLDFGSQQADENLYLVGDSFFPGQSTLACALGGIRLANEILRTL